MIIGITGKSGSGKSFISEKLKQGLNALHVEIDKVSHDVLYHANSIPFLKSEFGESVFENEKLNRKKLGEIVFNDKTKLTKLNQFCQSQMEDILDDIVIKNPDKTIILDYALLPWLKQYEKCDIKILVTSSFEDRFQRASKRENISKEYARRSLLKSVTSRAVVNVIANGFLTALQKRKSTAPQHAPAHNIIAGNTSGKEKACPPTAVSKKNPGRDTPRSKTHNNSGQRNFITVVIFIFQKRSGLQSCKR